ncbi:unnamed protein product [Mytilus coruscus]|uniref:Mab-21-like HhH/H2TH-like domain-containing protein n=1 Tax=Mytilus coruscus TaxID=42192 RepID=A0A6J8C237_MYTCO|nr:unnamed protein product [Mytilus coruscus]
MAEKELSEALRTVQKRVLLIVKAFNKCTLRNYSKIVTSFHWKTALYWISERVDQSIIEQNTEGNVFKLLHLLLDYMKQCLTEHNLQHYFIESNLFEGMDHQEASSINQLILQIQKNPETELQVFVSMDGYGQEQCETIARRKLQEFLRDFNDHQLTLHLFKSVFNRYIEEKDKLREALRDVLTSVFDDFVERESKRKFAKCRKQFVDHTWIIFRDKFRVVRGAGLIYIRNGKKSTLKNLFPGVELIDGKYLPSDLLSDIRPEAFKHSRNIHKKVTQMDSTRGQNTLRVSLDHKIKPGLSLVHYADPKCPELSMAQNKQKKDIGLIKENVEKKSPRRFTKNTIFHQAFDPLIEALTNTEHILHQTSPPHPKKPKLDSSGDCSMSSDVPSTSGLSGRVNNESHREEEVRGNDGDDKVTIQYSYKTSKDFISVFPLKGKPKYLDEWLNRKRNWPPKDVVTDIYNREIKLAKAMTQLQRNVILIIKALQKSSLRDYTEIVTTFHWKTVVYLVSEKTGTQILENPTEDNILKLLQNVLKYMVDSLRKNDLQHYCVPSNLFAGKNEKEIYDIILKISEIQENLIGNLQNFFTRQSTHRVNVDVVSRSKIKEFQEMHSDPGDNVIVESVVSLLRGFVIENREVVRRALKDVLTEAVPYLIEEVTRTRDPNDKDDNSQIIQALSGADIIRNTLIDSAVSWLLDQMHSTEAPNVEDFSPKMFVLKMKKILTGNWC